MKSCDVHLQKHNINRLQLACCIHITRGLKIYVVSSFNMNAILIFPYSNEDSICFFFTKYLHNGNDYTG